MKPVKFTDARRRYRTAEQSAAPGYLARRFKAIRRLQRMKAAAHTVTTLRTAKALGSK